MVDESNTIDLKQYIYTPMLRFYYRFGQNYLEGSQEILKELAASTEMFRDKLHKDGYYYGVYEQISIKDELVDQKRCMLSITRVTGLLVYTNIELLTITIHEIYDRDNTESEKNRLVKNYHVLNIR